MIDTIVHAVVFDSQGVDTLEASYIKGVLMGVRPSLVVSIDSTLTAEKMFCSVGVELIKL